MSAQPNPQYMHADLNARVKRAFSLTDNDIAANRAGQMTPSQQERLGQKQTDQAWSSCGSLALTIVVGFVLLTGVLANRRDPRGDRKDTGAIILCSMPIMGLFALSTLGNLSDDIHKKSVLSFQGAVKRSIGRHKRSTHYHVTSGAKSFEVPKEIYDAFIDHEMYILYYTDMSKSLVAAEHVSAAPVETSAPSPL